MFKKIVVAFLFASSAACDEAEFTESDAELAEAEIDEVDEVTAEAEVTWQSVEATQLDLSASLTPTASPRRCYFKCTGVPKVGCIKLNSGCNGYAKGWCMGKKNTTVANAWWGGTGGQCP